MPDCRMYQFRFSVSGALSVSSGSGLLRACCVALVLWTCASALHAVEPLSPRDLYNKGTQMLLEQELDDAESFLHSAVASNDERIQPHALYNLGFLRFELGKEELESGPDTRSTLQRGGAARSGADAAILASRNALDSTEVSQMLAAYWRGRGARKELKETLKVVQMALDSHGAALGRWQRSAGDFRSAVELRDSVSDAEHNAEIVDLSIAQLVDSIRQMQALEAVLGQQMEELKGLLSELRGRIPDLQGAPGPGDEEEDDDWPDGPEPGQREARSKAGDERAISPDDAERLLNAFRLDRGRPLPLGMENTAQPEDRRGRNW